MSRDSYIECAFDALIESPKEPECWYVCLMERAPFYGGPEEGGWWGEDHIVVKYAEFASEELARDAAERIRSLASELQDQARQQHGQHCLNQMEWLDARGLDADFLPEDDGPSEFYVRVTQQLPVNSIGERGYS